jgi:hypothetical protein
MDSAPIASMMVWRKADLNSPNVHGKAGGKG